MGLHPKNLSRSLEDAGTMFNCLIPWSSAGVFYIGALGVWPADFWIWEIPCYLSIGLAIFYGFTGISIAKLGPNDKRYLNHKQQMNGKKL
ncbi:hypothetical protein CCE28_15570 [Anaeromicrobium sediminis]|uniref:Na+/H+ antiporter NhaC-like C-terminal domain-containing protein n=1 Tax=Anaeromicrobium sediminis TaxID=1478221 RepID=A0A267MHK3_9FIRM|nr:hypothetical protein CCE28_15570 [Anaeromicrobium sediminis]